MRIMLVLMLLATTALAHDHLGNANWISEGGYVSPNGGAKCCGIKDCFYYSDVSVVPEGYFIAIIRETVPWNEVQISPDGKFWRCRNPDGSRRCFFAPPSTT